MFSKTEWALAFRYLKSRKQTGFVSVIAGFSLLGIMIGVATLIIVMSVMNGFHTELMSRVLGVNGQLGVYPAWGSYLTQYEEKIEVVKSLPHVARVVPVLDGQVMASSEGASSGVMIRGIKSDDFLSQPLLADGYQGLDMSLFDENGVILGHRLARRLAVRAGDSLTLISPKGNITAFGTIPKMKSFTVVGTFDTGMFEYDNHFLFMPLSVAQKYLMVPEKVSHLEIFADHLENVPLLTEQIFDRLDSSQAQVYDWRHSNQALYNAVEVEQNVLFFILTLIIIVAAFNMISGLIMLVRDKVKDIAVLRTMGISRGAVMRIFLLAGFMIGATGTILGVLLGLLISYNIDAIKTFLENLSGSELFSAEIYFLSRLPSEVNLTSVAGIAVMALVLSLLATLYPAWKAGKTDPVEALRYE